MSQKFPFQNGMSHCDLIFTSSGFKQNSTKITFYAWKHHFWHKVIPPSAFPLFSSKNKNFIASIFRDVSFQKQLQQPPGESILLKFCQSVSNRKNKKSPSLEVLDRAVLELWLII